MAVDLNSNTIAGAYQVDLHCVNVLEGVVSMAVCAPARSRLTRSSAIEPTDFVPIRNCLTDWAGMWL